jgi:alpha-tubulin suppressor-like RCC1 family protein
MKKWFNSGLTLLFLGALAACGGAPTPKIEAVSVTTVTSISSGSSQLVAAEVTGSGAFSQAITWTSSAGTLSKTTGSVITFTAPSVSIASDVTITATSTADSSKSGSVVVSVTPIPVTSSISGITASADISTVNAASQAVLNAVVSGTNGFSNAVNWSIISGNGTLSAGTGSSVNFTAPSLPVSSTTLIRATSVQDSSKTAIVTLSINATAPNSSISSVGVTANPSTALNANATSSLSATVVGTGAFGSGVLWNIVSGGGTIDTTTGATTTFTAPNLSAASTTIIRASSVQDPSKTGTVSLSIAANTTGSSITDISIETNKVNLREGGSSVLQGFVIGTGSFSQALTWTIDSSLFSSAGNGSLSSSSGSSVLYTAPTTSFGRVVRITASSVQDPSKSKTILLGVHSNKQSISASNSHSLAVSSTGGVLSWGNDSSGQLGNGDFLGNPDQPTPAEIGGLGGIVAVSAGRDHSLALRSDGTMVAWGRGTEGQLGNGGFTTQQDRVNIPNVNGIVAISAGNFHSLALKSDGTMLSWGNNGSGELGDGTIGTSNPIPTAVTSATNIVAIAAGGFHSLALKSDGTMLSWGNDGNGQLGDGTIGTNNPTPTAVTSATNIVAIAAGNSHSLALKSDGTMLSWGYDSFGQLGGGTIGTINPIPTAVTSATNIVAIAAGNSHSLALKSDGTMLSWGYDGFGQLGDGTIGTNNPTPSAVALGVGVTVRLP